MKPQEIVFGSKETTALDGAKALVTEGGVFAVIDNKLPDPTLVKSNEEYVEKDEDGQIVTKMRELVTDVLPPVDGNSPLLSVRFNGKPGGIVKVAHAEAGTTAAEWVDSVKRLGVTDQQLKDGFDPSDPENYPLVEFRVDVDRVKVLPKSVKIFTPGKTNNGKND